MTYVLLALGVLVAFLAGAVAFALGLYRFLLASSLAGRPVLMTLPGNRPNHQVTYAITPRGYRRLSVGAALNPGIRKGLRKLTEAELEAAMAVAEDKPLPVRKR